MAVALPTAPAPITTTCRAVPAEEKLLATVMAQIVEDAVS